MTHPDPLDRYCAEVASRPPARDEVLEIRAQAVVQGRAELVARCDRVLETLLDARQERGRAA